MPAYGVNAIPSGLYPGDVITLINLGDNSAGAMVIPFAGQEVGMGYVQGMPRFSLRLELSFFLISSGQISSPGSVEVDLQEASVNSPNNYKTVGSATVVDANDTMAIDLIDAAVGPFFRPYLKTFGNVATVYCVATLRRM